MAASSSSRPLLKLTSRGITSAPRPSLQIFGACSQPSQCGGITGIDSRGLCSTAARRVATISHRRHFAVFLSSKTPDTSRTPRPKPTSPSISTFASSLPRVDSRTSTTLDLHGGRELHAVNLNTVGLAALRAANLNISNSSPIIARRPVHHIVNQARYHGSHKADPNAERIKLQFEIPNEGLKTVDAEVGKSLLEVAHANEIPVEGACEGSLACSTCHVILSEKLFNKLEYPTDEEQDMLDLAPELTETSRLGCQCLVNKNLYENEVIQLPKHTLNFYVDGHKPVGH